MSKSIYLCQALPHQRDKMIPSPENVIHQDSGKVPWGSSDAPCAQVVCRPTGPMVPGRKKPPRPWSYKCPGLSCNVFSTNNPITLSKHLETHDSASVSYNLEFPEVPASPTHPPTVCTDSITTASSSCRVAIPQLPIQKSSSIVKPPTFR